MCKQCDDSSTYINVFVSFHIIPLSLSQPGEECFAACSWGWVWVLTLTIQRYSNHTFQKMEAGIAWSHLDYTAYLVWCCTAWWAGLYEQCQKICWVGQSCRGLVSQTHQCCQEHFLHITANSALFSRHQTRLLFFKAGLPAGRFMGHTQYF